VWLSIGQNAIVYDEVPESIRGRASGCAGSLKSLGAIAGIVLLVVFVEVPLHTWLYWTYVVVLFATGAVVCLSSPEPPADREPPLDPLRCIDLVKSYQIDVHSSFWFVTVSRATYYSAVAVQGYFIFFFRDVLGSDETSRKWQVVLCALLGQVFTALFSPLGGKVSDRIGRKPLIYFACVNTALVYIGTLFAPKVFSTAGFESSPKMSPALVAIFALSALWGVGNGFWRSADYALAMDCMPNKNQTAKELAMWNLGLYLGMSAGNLVCGGLANCFKTEEGLPNEEGGGIAYMGYVVALGFGVTAALGTAILALRI